MVNGYPNVKTQQPLTFGLRELSARGVFRADMAVARSWDSDRVRVRRRDIALMLGNDRERQSKGASGDNGGFLAGLLGFHFSGISLSGGGTSFSGSTGSAGVGGGSGSGIGVMITG